MWQGKRSAEISNLPKSVRAAQLVLLAQGLGKDMLIVVTATVLVGLYLEWLAEVGFCDYGIEGVLWEELRELPGIAFLYPLFESGLVQGVLLEPPRGIRGEARAFPCPSVL